jgi:hypothetical protein
VVLALHAWRGTVHVGPGLDGLGDGLMERLQWWLLLLSAVMFSMSGCGTVRAWHLAALRDWQEWSAHPAHFASAHHLAFSVKSHDTVATISEADTEAAAREDWWGRLVPEEKATVVAASAPAPTATMDMTGHWRGRWVANGPWGDRRESDAEVVFLQSGDRGTGRMKLADTVAAVGVPEVVRYFGALGTPVNYRISRGQVLARYEDGPAMLVRFTRVGDRIYGRVDASPSFLLVLDRQ